VTHEVSCIIPANRTQLLDRVVESVVGQSFIVAEIIVVLASPELEWQSASPLVSVVKQSRSLRKAPAVLVGLSRAKGDLVLSIDCDTILADNALGLMVASLTSEMEVVCARIRPLDTSTWIGKARDDLYQKWHAQPRLINGACFLARRSTLETLLPQLTTMVEDQELTRFLNSPRRWTICQGAVAKTEEPRTLGDLFRQLVRWSYGSEELRAKIEAHLRLGATIFVATGALAFLGAMFALLVGETFGFLVLGSALVLGYAGLVVSYARLYRMKGVTMRRTLPYAFIEAAAFVTASIRFVLRKAPPW